jgi:hypothetical protein
MLLSINRNILDKGISMSSKTDQLIAKALSTTSEDEAIACLRMARKHNTGGASTQSTTSNTTDWEASARKYHKLAYKLQEDLKLANIQMRFYADSSARHALDAKFAKRNAAIAARSSQARVVVGIILMLFAASVSFVIGYSIR